MKKFFTEFKEFISRGNVVDMAVAVIIGNAFKAIVNSLVNDIIMPLISMAVGGLSFTEWKWVLKPGVEATETTEAVAEVAVSYGIFIQAIIDFLIVAFCIFLALKVILAFQTKAKELMVKKQEEEVAEAAAAAEAAAPAESQEDILRDIRELLRAKES